MINIKNIRKTYGNEITLKNISLTIQRGTCFGIIGPNGAGKSTLMKIIVGIIQPNLGSISLQAEEEANWTDKIGYIPQEVCLEDTITAKQQLEFYGEVHRLTKKERIVRVDEVLKEVGLFDRKEDKISTFSSGMKRRLHIGCALLHQPEIILMDEPTVGIDPQSRQAIYTLIKRLVDQQCTILYSSHYIEEVEKICDDVAFMDEGEIILTNRVKQLIKNETVPQIYVEWTDAPPASLLEHIEAATPYDQGVLMETNQTTQMEHLQAIIDHTKQSQKHVAQLTFMQSSLEDIFFEYTGTTLRDERKGTHHESDV